METLARYVVSGLCPDKFAWKPCTSGHRPDPTPFAKMLFGGFFATPKYSEKGMSVTQKIRSVIEKVIWMTDFIMSITDITFSVSDFVFSVNDFTLWVIEKVKSVADIIFSVTKSPFPSLTL